jgi:hypothetical protein
VEDASWRVSEVLPTTPVVLEMLGHTRSCFDRRTVVRCGPSTLQWHDLQDVATNMFYETNWPQILHLLLADAPRRDASPLAMHALQRNLNRGSYSKKYFETKVVLENPRALPWLEFIIIIDRARVFQATDPRDKIYSILGLAQRLISEGSTVPIVPKYNQSTEEIYTELSALLLKEGPALFLLSMREDRKHQNLVKLPSWVPDWSHTEQIISLLDLPVFYETKAFDV